MGPLMRMTRRESPYELPRQRRKNWIIFKRKLTIFLFSSDLLSNTISTSEEWSSLGKEANGGENNNEATNNLHLLASAGLDDLAKEDSGGGLEDADSNTSTPRKRKRSSDDNIRMQTDVVRVPGISQELQQQITKFDSSEFDVSKRPRTI